MNDKDKIEMYISKHPKWESGLRVIQNILANTEMDEVIKWNMPTYTVKGKNVISLSAFKNHFGLWFHNGAFLKDEHGILENAQEGKTKGMRHIKFYNVDELDIALLSAYVDEAIQNQKDGKEIRPERIKNELEIPQILIDHLSTQELSNLRSMSIAKRNEYISYITGAKRESTKQTRLEKIKPMIQRGVGLNDLYK